MVTQKNPAYAPTQTFLACIRHLQVSGIPEHIDPPTIGLQGRDGTWTHVRSSFRWLALIDAEDRPTVALKALVKAIDKSQWQSALVTHVLPVYASFIDAINKQGEKLTRDALAKEFENAGCTSPDTLKKAVRFCADIHAEAGIQIPLVDISRAVREAKRRKQGKGAASAKIPAAQARATLHTHRFRLRPDLELRIALPGDLTLAEVTRFAKFLELVAVPE